MEMVALVVLIPASKSFPKTCVGACLTRTCCDHTIHLPCLVDLGMKSRVYLGGRYQYFGVNEKKIFFQLFFLH
jgi:hypothetical protein